VAGWGIDGVLGVGGGVGDDEEGEGEMVVEELLVWGDCAICRKP
jgi:hypothetical protein